jgi:DUF1707 SHOCT-like domain
MPVNPEMRASDADRDRAVDVLRAAAGEGRLTVEEFDQRLEAALSSRTLGELAALLADLGPGAGVSPAAEAGESVIRTSQRGGSVRRAGRWVVPPRLEMRPSWCDVTLDFTDAVIMHDTLLIDMNMRGGSLTLVVGPGIVVDADALTVRYADVEIDAGAEPGVPVVLRVQLAGRMRYGWIGTRRVQADSEESPLRQMPDGLASLSSTDRDGFAAWKSALNGVAGGFGGVGAAGGGGPAEGARGGLVDGPPGVLFAPVVGAALGAAVAGAGEAAGLVGDAVVEVAAGGGAAAGGGGAGGVPDLGQVAQHDAGIVAAGPAAVVAVLDGDRLGGDDQGRLPGGGGGQPPGAVAAGRAGRPVAGGGGEGESWRAGGGGRGTAARGLGSLPGLGGRRGL